MEFGRYKIYKEKKEYRIYDVYGKMIAVCYDEKVANIILKSLQSSNDRDILDEQERLNSIPEPQRDPINRNSILFSPIAKATRELLGKEK